MSSSRAPGHLSEPLNQPPRSACDAQVVVPSPVFTYLANAIRIGDRDDPVFARHGDRLCRCFHRRSSGSAAACRQCPIVLNDVGGARTGRQPGDRARARILPLGCGAGLQTVRRRFSVDRHRADEGIAADRRLAPDYPGITGADSLCGLGSAVSDRSRPDPAARRGLLGRVSHGAEGLHSLRAGAICGGRGTAALTSIRARVSPDRWPSKAAATSIAAALERASIPRRLASRCSASGSLRLGASRGATDFGEYFTYFSFFIVVSALLLAALFFRLGIEQRLRQIGILRATGFTIAHVRRLFLIEAGVLAVVGSLARYRWCGRLRHADRVRPAHVVGRRGRHHAARGPHRRDARSLIGAAGGDSRCRCLRHPGAAHRCQASRRERCSARSRSTSAPVPTLRRAARSRTIGLVLMLALAMRRSARSGFSATPSQTGAFFGAGALLLTGSLLLVRVLAQVTRLARRCRSRHRAWFRLGFRGRGVPAGAKRAVRGAGRLRRLHDRLGGRVPPRGGD